ncbi:MAG: thermonuclease family protein [Candidatus Limnocylindria bacterium]
MRPRPERLLGIILVLVLAAGLVAVVALSQGGSAPPGPAASGGPRGDVDRGRVVRIADGDTVTVEIGGIRERVRYVGIDAPEVANQESGRTAECGADAATEANRELVEGAELVLERDATDRDRFGRLLRHPWIQRDGAWIYVSEALVVAGAVEARTFEPDTLHDARLDRAERVARGAGTGIWGAC